MSQNVPKGTKTYQTLVNATTKLPDAVEHCKTNVNRQCKQCKQAIPFYKYKAIRQYHSISKYFKTRLKKNSRAARAKRAFIYTYRGTCHGSEATARCGIGEDTSIKVQRNDMPSLTSQFGDTREISSEQHQNIAKITKIYEKFQNFIWKLKKLALSSAQLIALGLLTPDTHIARDETKKFEKNCEKKIRNVQISPLQT